MGEDKIEEKLKIEVDITALKREYKNFIAQVSAIKSEYAGTASIVENNKKLIEEQTSYLTDIQNDISNAKLNWMSEKEEQIKEVNVMKHDAQMILDTRAKLTEQQEKIDKTKLENTAILNEIRQAKLDIKRDEDALAVREREIETKDAVLADKYKELEANKQDFKNKVGEVFETIKNI